MLEKIKRIVSCYMYHHSFYWRYYFDNKADQHLFNKVYNTNTLNKKVINDVIILFNGNISLNKIITHGGLADRLKGIISIYKTCKEQNRHFKILHTAPYLLTQYLQPNTYSWIINQDDVCYDLKYVSPHIIDTISIKNEKTYYRKRIKRILQNNKQIHIFSNICIANDFEFYILFNELFKPSPILEYEINKNLNKIGCAYISCSFRFTHLLGDPIDEYMLELPNNEKETLMQKMEDAIINMHQQFPNHKILINSDSERFLSYIKMKCYEYIYITEGTPIHIDQNKNASQSSYLKTFCDFYLISNASFIFLIKTNQMYNSAFPKYAALIKNKPITIINV